ncbi:MAG: THUMP domain-containing protein [Flavobacteriaceae bacterium]
MEKNFKMIAKTFYGFEEVLAAELRTLGASEVVAGNRSVTFEGDMGFMYKANLCLRTALRILKPLLSFRIRNEKELYQRVYAFDWEAILGTDQTLAVSATLISEKYTHSLYIAQRVKDAVVDKFRDHSGKRPSVDKHSPDVQIHIHIQEDHCHLSLDSSGDSLHRRGYRTITNIAPLNEVLAAGLLLLSGWKGQCDFLDPMCGSGTILIEAALIACNIPANLNRKHFSFQNWRDYDPELFDTILKNSLSKTREFPFEIRGFDKAPSAVSKAHQNIENANLSEFIKVERRDFFTTSKQGERHLHLLFNPPYGERLRVEPDIFYKKIGDTLKRHYPGSDAWLITSNLEALKFVGLRPTRKIKVFNARLESRLVEYKMYSGSKKAKYNKEP